MSLRAGLLTTLAGLLVAGAGCAQQVSFAREVLPLLSDRCLQCHGPDARARKADLRLDDRLDVLRERDGYAIVRPGQPEESELIRRITATDEERMPPRHTKLTLSSSEVALLRRWVAQGAEWSEHWSFAPIADAEPPAVDDASWPRDPLDRFVLARLERAGAAPNAPADPATLVRRVHLDLTGLPPTPDVVAAFVADPSDARYLELVDGLLASPHYGERMAWPWLEAARYADTDGFQNDPTRTAWPWRDWLVRALNDNLPFDQFTHAVLAGDLLPDATDEQRLATGLLRNNAHNGEGGRIPEETRVENVFDRAETVGTVWLGMTLECARCHDHKYDPVSQQDYYRFFAFFDQTSETGGGRSGGVLPPAMRYVPDPDARAQLASLRRAAADLEKRLFTDDPALDEQQAAWQVEAARRVRALMRAQEPSALGAWQQSARIQGKAGELFGARLAPERPEGAADAGWRAAEEFVDGRALALPAGVYAAYFRRTVTAASPRTMTLSLGSDDAIKLWHGGELVLANDTRRGVKADQERVTIDLAAGANELLLKIVNTGGAGGAYFRAVDELPGGLPADVTRALLHKDEARSDDERALLRAHYRRAHQEGFASSERELKEAREKVGAIERRAVSVSVMDQLPEERRRETCVLARGDYQVRRQPVTPGTPSFLPPLAQADAADRLALARWLTRPDPPLVARVAANRAWQTFFGRGLVATSENFGRQGERPTHPGLLDWLARRLLAEGWDLKALHRRIVTSATYRQAGGAAPQRFAQDPDNRALARYPRRRMPAWMLRDQALALSGGLVRRLGGAPVRPYQPAGIWDEATFGVIKYRTGGGEELRRRSLYTFWRRIVGPTALFDTPARQQCVVRRATTNTPLHALTTLNETGFVEAARGLATRALAAGAGAEEQIAWMFRAATARAPEPAELQVMARRFASARARFAAGELQPDAFLAIGASAPAQDRAPEDLAAMTVVASLLLNLDEVLCLP